MKSIKKSAAILLIIAMFILLAGCSNEELAFFQMSMDSNNLSLKPMEQTGEISLKAVDLESLLSNSKLDDKQQAALQAVWGLLSLKYDVKADLSKNIMEYTFYCKDRTNTNYSELVKLIMVNDTLYIKLDKLCKFLRATGNPTVTAFLDRGIQDAEYLTITSDSHLNSLGVTSSDPSYPKFRSMFTISRQIKTNQLMMKFMDGLVKQVYTDYKTGFITQDGDKYIISLDVSQIMPFLKEFLFYTLDNFDRFALYTGNFINNMTEEELALFYLNTETKQEIVEGLEFMKPMILLNKEKYKNSIAEVLDQANLEISKVLAGSTLISSTEKIGNTEYKSDFTLNLKINDEGKHFNISLQGNQNFKECQSFSVSVPSGKMLTLEELQTRVNRVIRINIDSGSWELREDQSYLQGNSTVKIINGSTYLPLRQIAEALGEKVFWDVEKSKAYIERDGKRVYMTGVIIKGTLYIKTRDFTTIGYKVDWDGKSRIVKLTKLIF